MDTACIGGKSEKKQVAFDGRRIPINAVGAAILSFLISLVPQGSGPRAQSADWPVRPVRVITPQPAGTGIDIAARLFAERLSAKWGKPVFVENRPGADGVIGVAAFVNAHDDHTLLFSFGSPLTISPQTSQIALPYDPKTDLVPISNTVDIILAISASATVDLVRMDDVVKEAKATPGKLNWGATAGLPEFVFSGYLRATGLEMAEVPYKELSSALGDLTQGRIQVFATSYASLRPLLGSKKARLLAVLNRQRAPLAPDIPTIGELGFPQLAVDSFAGFFGNRTMPEGRRARIAADILEVSQDSQIATRLAPLGMVVKAAGPADFGPMITAQYNTVRSILAATAVK